MRKRLFRLMLVVVIGISLGGCASIERWCGHQEEKEQIIAQPQPEVRPTPPPPPPVKPVPPKKDRN